MGLNLFNIDQAYKYRKQEEKDATSLGILYSYWQEMLLNRIIRIFEWTGLPFPQHELELYTMLNGIGYTAFHNKTVGIVTGIGSAHGVTRYPDIFTEVTYSLPDENSTISGTKKIGEDAVILYNTSLSMGMDKFINRYASLLAHGDISYKCALVSGRMQEVLAAADSSTKESIDNYFQGKYEGKPQAIIDETLSDIDGGLVNIAKTSGTIDYMAIIDAQNEILRAFYRDLGIRWTRQKRGNMTEDEVDSDGQMLTFNINDMLHCRINFCNEYNRVFKGRAETISVKIASELEGLVNEEEIEEDEQRENDNI